jgi:cytochrome P450
VTEQTDVTQAAALPSAGASRLSEWQKVRQDPLGMLESLAPLGDVVFFHAARRKSYILIHPDYIKDVLVTNHRKFTLTEAWQELRRLLGNGLLHSEGEFHKRQRRLVNPAFHHTRIASYADVMASIADRTSARWHDGDEVDLHQEMIQLTLAVVSKTLFDTDIDRPDAAEFREAINDVVPLFRLGTPIQSLLRRMPVATTKSFDEIRATLDAFIYRMIEERRSGERDRGDLLSMLLLAQDEEGDGGSMTDEQVRDEAMTLVAAGHETTANALAWTWYALAENPHVEAKLHAELEAVLGGRLPTVADLPSLPYTRNVLNETMRLYPPAWILLRKVVEDYSVGGYDIPVGANVLMFPYLVHRDPRWWPEPTRFNPDRWTDEADAQRPKYAYIPFGAGPRMCIGENFAWLEAVVVVATLAQRWRARVPEGHTVEPEPRVNLRPKGGLPMRLEART